MLTYAAPLQYGQTALNIASQGGHTDVVALLVAARCNVHLAENVNELHPSLFSAPLSRLNLSIHPTYLPIYRSIYLSIYQALYLSINLSINYIYPIELFIYPSINTI